MSGRPSGGVPGGGGGSGGDADCSDAATPSAAPGMALPEKDDTVETATVVAAAKTFVGTLDSKRKSSLSLDYDDLETRECSWSNLPDGLFNGRVGPCLGDLSDEQASAALAVVAAAMSTVGYTVVTQELEADNQLSNWPIRSSWP